MSLLYNRKNTDVELYTINFLANASLSAKSGYSCICLDPAGTCTYSKTGFLDVNSAWHHIKSHRVQRHWPVAK